MLRQQRDVSEGSDDWRKESIHIFTQTGNSDWVVVVRWAV